MFSDSEKVAIAKIFKNSGFLGVINSEFVFSHLKTTSYVKFEKLINFPKCFSNNPETKDIYISAFEGNFNKTEFLNYIEEYSVAYRKQLAKEREDRENGVSAMEQIQGSLKKREAMTKFLLSLIPVVDIRSEAKNKIILLSKENHLRPMYDIDVEMYLSVIGKEFKDVVSDPVVPLVMSKFNPYRLDSLYDEKIPDQPIEALTVNTYVPPSWRFVDCAPRLHGFILDLITHLFPIEEEREAVLDWLHYSLVSRCETILCLVGARGTGKGVLMNDIHSQLIGERYREVVGQSILTKEFNASFVNKRYMFFDEVNISGSAERSKFKAFANRFIAVEGKGKDAETIENYTSMALACNDRKDVVIQPQERRFSVPEVTDRPFNEVYSEVQILDFIERIRTPGSVELAEFGQFLLTRIPQTRNQTPIKGKYYFELSKLSMPEWQTFLIDYFISEGMVKEEVTISELKKLFIQQYGKEAKIPSKRATYIDFLLDYKHEGKYRIAETVDSYDEQRGRDTFALLPSTDFILAFGKQNKRRLEEEKKVEEMLHAKPTESKINVMDLF